MGTRIIESDGFYNTSDFAPYCTWLYWVQDVPKNLAQYLLVWIPPEYIDAATWAANSDAEELTVFLKDAEFDIPYEALLAEHNLLI